MSIRNLSRITCVVLGHGQCECKPVLQFLKSSYCTVRLPRVATVKTVVPHTRLLSSIPGNDNKENQKENLNKDKDEQKLSTKDKLKKLWKNYGIIAVSTYLGIYASTLTGVFLCLDFDVFNAASVGLDPVYAINKFSDLVETFTGNTHIPEFIRDNPRVGTFAIAYIMTKFTEPLRLGVTIVAVPRVARWLGKRKAEGEKEKDH